MDPLTDSAEILDLRYYERLRERALQSIKVREQLLESNALEIAAQVARVIVESYKRDNQTIFFGNGGSSMDAGHLAAEFLGKYEIDRPAMRSVSLPDCTAAVTAIGNDFGYQKVFSRQLEGIARPGDVAVGLTTSGNSTNVVAALQQANEIGVTTVAFTGPKRGKVAEIADYVISVPGFSTADIQECQMLVGHTICELVEADLFASK